MKKKMLAFICLLAILIGVFAIGATATTQENTYQVGYAKVDVSPWIKDYVDRDGNKAANMTDDAGNAIGIPYDSAWAEEYADLLTTTSVVVDTQAKTATDVGFLAAPVGYSGRIYSTVIDTNGDKLRGKGDGIYVTTTTVTDSKGNTVLFVTLDGIAGYPALLNALKTSAVEAIAAEGGNLTADHIYVNGSHSHRGIDLIRLASDTTAPGKAYWAYYKQMATEAAVNAYKNRTAATMSKGQVDVSDTIGHKMNFIRHYNTDQVDATTEKTIIRGSNFGGTAGKQTSHVYDADDMLYLLKFTPTNGDAPIVLMNWRAHGTMVNTSDALSGDHIGAIRSTMENAGYRFAFLQGAAGNAVPSSVITSLNTWTTETASGFSYSSVDSNTTIARDENWVNHYAHLMTKAAEVCLKSHMEQLDVGEIRTMKTSFVSNKQKDTAVEIEAAFYWHDTMGGPTAKNQIYTIDGVEYTFGGWPWIYTSASGETAIFDSQYHVSNAYDRNKTEAARAATTNGGIRIDAIMLGDKVAMVTCGNEISDRYSSTDALVYTEGTGWSLRDNDNDWKDLYNAVYGTPFVLGYTNAGHAYMSNSLSYTYNEGSVAVAGGCYESQTSSFAQGTGEAMIVQFKSMLDTLNIPEAAIGETTYTNLETALSAAQEGQTVKLILDITDAITIPDKAITLDLNGYNMQSVTVTGSAATFMDSKTDDYDVSDGDYGKITTLSGTASAADGYLAVTDGGTSFHKVDLKITAMSLRASVAGVYYKSSFLADEVASKGITRCGVALSVKGEPNETNMDKTCAYSSFSTIPSGDATGTLLKNIMKTGNTDANNSRNANMLIYGRPYILTQDGDYIFGKTVQRSLEEQLEAISANWTNYSEAAQKTVITMYRKYQNVMKNWNIPNIKNEVAAETMKIMMVGNSFCYYYVEELYGLLMANPDPDRGYGDVEIYNLYYSGCRLNQHYDWWQAGEAKYELFKTDKNGRVKQAPASGSTWKLEDALMLDSWDYLSLQGASGETDYTDSAAVEANKASIAQYAGPLLDRFYELHPDAQLLWHRTWPFEVGRISGSITYTEELNAAYNTGMQITCDWMCNEFDQDKPYDLKIVNSGAAWPIAREENAKLAETLIPVGGLCARLGVANANTYQYVKDNPDAKNVGDGYHDGDIGGGQFLNACVWYETITGQSCLDNPYKPTTANGNYELGDAFANLLRNAANKATIHQ